MPSPGGGFRALAVFCGSRAGNRPEYAEAARQVGRTLAEQGVELVFGGGSIGMMGEAARAAMAAGGRVTGVIPDALMKREVGLSGVTRMHVVDSMHERKALMAELSDGFIALPGGFGTMEEYFEVLTWAQLRFHEKPVGLLDVAGFFAPLVVMFDHMVAEGFVSDQHRALVIADRDPVALLGRMAQYRAPASDGAAPRLSRQQL